jgi:ribonuclease-3
MGADANSNEVGRGPGFPAFQAKIGYEFNDPDLLIQALTHASYNDKHKIDLDNERLEFLGDRVLGLVIANALFKAFPTQPEGRLALRLNTLVQRDALADVAADLRLEDLILVGRAEKKTPMQSAILANACEALIGAIYVDGGLEAAQIFVEKNWRQKLDDAQNARQDPKTALQEWAQGGAMAPPAYTVVERSGPDHAPKFVVEVALENGPTARGEGASKQRAQQAAAQKMLRQEGVWTKGDDQ